ncbi:MAG: putative Rossmann fold flavoprotein [Phenylobacterium sp.]|jgi:predicted Rossmann fold flavoprotein
MSSWDVIIIGAGAAGLMCGAQAAYRGRKVLVLDHAKKAGQKIIMSGGGRCNFTNMYTEPQNFLSDNDHFCKSALKRYTQWDFLALVEKHKIDYHERSHGQYFCLDSAKQIVTMLLDECEAAKAKVQLRTEIVTIAQQDGKFTLCTTGGIYTCDSLVIATGGLSMPKIGATPFGYKVAEQFGLQVLKTTAGLVPFTLHTQDKEWLEPLSGIAFDVEASCNGTSFKEALLFTHRGLSGPVILQISNYWKPGDTVEINMLPDIDLAEELAAVLKTNPAQELKTVLAQWLPKRFIQQAIEAEQLISKPLKQYNHKELQAVCDYFHQWKIKPNGTEGYRTAEVTLGGLNSDELSSKTLEVKSVKGLYFIGEVVDVTGWLGGFNFQWAWASGWCAGQFV